MRDWLGILTGAALLACAAPAAAQDAAEDDAALATAVAAFNVEPLTAEQQARLPAAQEVVDKVMPPGTLKEMTGSMFDGMLQPLMALAGQPSEAEAARQLGVAPEEIDLDEAAAAEVLALLDPAWRERQERTMVATQEATGRMMTAMEPAMRTAMAELYAINFNDRELADIDAFFSTASGATYARKSYLMAGDSRLTGSLMQSLPDMMGSFAQMEADLAAATADLPPPRGYGDLARRDRARLAELTGLGQGEIEAGLARAAASADEDETEEED